MKTKIMAVFIAITALSACSTQRFAFDNVENQQAAFHGTSHFMYWGLFQENEIIMSGACRENQISALETRRSIPNALFSIFTLGIYDPLSYNVYCKKRLSEPLQLNGSGRY